MVDKLTYICTHLLRKKEFFFLSCLVFLVFLGFFFFVLVLFFLFCFVLFFVLFCFVLFCFVLFCFFLFCFVLFCFVLFCFFFLWLCGFVVLIFCDLCYKLARKKFRLTRRKLLFYINERHKNKFVCLAICVGVLALIWCLICKKMSVK